MSRQYSGLLNIVRVAASFSLIIVLQGCGQSEFDKEADKMDKQQAQDDAAYQRREKEQLERERKEQARQHQDDVERQTATERQKKQETDRDEEERQSNERAAKEDIQKLAALVVEPPVNISTKLRGFGATTAFRAEVPLDQVQKLFKAKDWNGVIKILGCGPDKGEWLTPTQPGPRATGAALAELQRNAFYLLVKTAQALPFKQISRVFYDHTKQRHEVASALFCVSIPSRFNRPEDWPFQYDTYSGRRDTSHWRKHPDGNGYLCQWNTHTAEMFLFFGEDDVPHAGLGYIDLTDKLNKLMNDYKDKVGKAVQKKELGEFAQSQLDQEIVRLRAGVRSSLVALLNEY